MLLISSLLLIAILAITNKIRGSSRPDLKKVKFKNKLHKIILTFRAKLPLGARHHAMILFGFFGMLYLGLNGVVSIHAPEILLITLFGVSLDFSLMIGLAVGFLVLVMLGWGEYMDMGTWQREHKQEKETAFVDVILNKLAGLFPKFLIRRDKWEPKLWATKHAYTDAVGMFLRMTIMSVPLYMGLAYYLDNMFILVLPYYVGIVTMLSYFIMSRKHPDIDFTAKAEYLTGGLAFAPTLIFIAFIV